MDTGTIINLVITGIIAFFLISGMFWGLVRGLRKTAIRSVWLVVTAGILILFLSSTITNAIMNAEITINMDGETFNGFKELIAYYVENSNVDMSALGESLDVVVQTLIAYVSIFLNSIVFVVLFWILKIVLLPLNWALSKWVFIGKKEKQYRKAKKEYKKYIKAYNKMYKGKPAVEAMGFAENKDDKKLVEDELKEVKEKKNTKNLASLLSARKAFDDLVVRTQQQKEYKELQEVEREENELLDRPYVEKKQVVEEVQEEEYIPQEEYVPETEEKEEELELTPVPKPKKPSRHRFWGMIVGGMLGLFISAVTLSPVVGMMSLAEQINNDNEITLENNTKLGILDFITDGMFGEINKYYRDSIGINALKYTGTEWVATETFKALTKANIDGMPVDLSKDVVAIIGVVNELNNITENIEKAEATDYDITVLKTIINSIDKVIDGLFEVSIIDVLVPHIINISAEMLKSQVESNETNIIMAQVDGEDTQAEEIQLDTNKLLLNIADGLKEIKNTENLKKEFKSIIAIAKQLNYGVSVKTDNGNVSTSVLREFLKQSNAGSDIDMFTVVQMVNYEYYKTTNQYFFSQLINGVFEYDGYTPKVITGIMPTTMDFLFNVVLNGLSVDNMLSVSLDNASTSTLRTMLVDIFDEAFDIMLKFNTVKDSEGNNVFRDLSGSGADELSLKDMNIRVFRSVGKILDSLTTTFTDSEYSDLMSTLGTSLTDMMKPMFDALMTEEKSNTLCKNIGLAMSEITKEQGLDEEFEAIGVLFNYLITGESIVGANGVEEKVYPLLEGEYTFGESDNWEFAITNLSTLPSVLDAMQGIKIFSYLPKAESDVKLNNATYFFDSVIDKFKSDMRESIIEEGKADSLTNLSDKGYIVSDSITSVNQVLWNAFARIQKNLNEDVNKTTGAYAWKTSFGNANKFFDFMEMLLDSMGDSDNNLLNLGAEGNIIQLLISDDYVSGETVGSLVRKRSVLDEIASSKLLENVARNIILDFRSYITNSIDDTVELGDELRIIINEMLTNLGRAEDNNVTYYAYLITIDNALTNAKNNGLLKDGSFEMVADSISSIEKFGMFLDDLTLSTDTGASILSDSTIGTVVQSLIESTMLETTIIEEDNGETEEYSSKIASYIKNEKIYQPIENMLEVVKSNFGKTGTDAIYNGKYGSWQNIFGTLIKISNTSFADMSNTDNALATMGSILDILTGREYKIEDTDTEYISIPFMTDIDAKNCLIGLVANNLSDSGYEEDLMQIIFSVKSERNIINMDKTALKVERDGKMVGIFTKYNPDPSDMVGVLENIYNMTITSWSTFCTKLSSDMDKIDDVNDAQLGQFAYEIQENDGYIDKSYYHTFYDEGYQGCYGIEKTLAELMEGSNPLITIDHVKYLLQCKLNEDDYSEDYIKNVIGTIKTNISKLTKQNLEYEFKSISYFMDFAKADITLQDMGIYLDELSQSVILGDIGETVAQGAISVVEDITLEISDTEAEILNEQILNKLNSLELGNLAGENDCLVKDTSGNYSLNTDVLNKYLEANYGSDGVTSRQYKNTTWFATLQDVKDMLENPITTPSN